ACISPRSLHTVGAVVGTRCEGRRISVRRFDIGSGMGSRRIGAWPGSSGSRQGSMLVVMLPVGGMQVAVVQVIGVITVLDGRMPTGCVVAVRVCAGRDVLAGDPGVVARAVAGAVAGV